MKVIYVRASDEVADYFRQLAKASGLYMSDVLRLMIEDARRRGWSVTITGTSDEEDS